MGVFDGIFGIFCCASHADVAPAAVGKDVGLVRCMSDQHSAACAGGDGKAPMEDVLAMESRGVDMKLIDERLAGKREALPGGSLETGDAADPQPRREVVRCAEGTRGDLLLGAGESLDGSGPQVKDRMAGLPAHGPENILASGDSEAASDDGPVCYGGFFLPPQTHKKPTLVLDLDHTLVFPSSEKPEEPCFDVAIRLNGQHQRVWVVERPHLREFLNALHAGYEIVVFTAGIGEYGRAIVSQIDRDGRIAHVLHRRHCTPLEHTGGESPLYVKDLSRLGRDLRRTIIVDDREYSFLFNFANGQFVPPFTGDPGDNVLPRLQEYLLQCLALPDFSNRQCLGYE